MSDGPRRCLDVFRYAADPLGYLNEHLRAEAIGGGLVFGFVRRGTGLSCALGCWGWRVCRRVLHRRWRAGDRVQNFDDLSALALILKHLESLACLLRRYRTILRWRCVR